MVLTLVPTIVEFVLVIGILAYEFDWLYSWSCWSWWPCTCLHLSGDRVADRASASR
jgi:ABC-type transport system involved in Fe-S cluster assembly fused permease/ATPase subunit